MTFNSLTFLVFLLVVFSLYWLLDRHRQNMLLLVASYVFYEEASSKTVPCLRDSPSILIVFHLVLIGWVFFRASSLAQVGNIFSGIVTDFNWTSFLTDALKLKALIIFLLLAEWVQRNKVHPLQFDSVPRPVRWFAYNGVAAAILPLGTFDYTPFIYFQF